MTLGQLIEQVTAAYPSASSTTGGAVADAGIEVGREDLLGMMRDLEAGGFSRFEMVTAVDREDRFELVYRLVSRRHSASLVVRCAVPRDQMRVSSVTSVWDAADWQEREVYDLFGMEFGGHPCLKRVLLPEDFVGHPLRKDYESDRLIRRPDYI